MQNKLLISHLKLHLIVFIYGFTAIFGKLIDLSAVHLVWYRVLIAGLTLFFLFRFDKTNINIPGKEILKLLGLGFIVGLHWITFFGAIKLSNISVTLGCLATTTLFTGILEPLLNKKKPNKIELIIGVIIIFGLYLIFQFETRFWKGIIVALISSLLAVIFTVVNKKLVAVQRARVISIYEMLGSFLGITLFLIVSGNFRIEHFAIDISDLIYLLILGIICTAFAFVVQVDVMKKLSAYNVALVINLEPVYGILLAFFIFGESELMSAGFYIGTIVILISVIGYHVYVRFKNKQGFNI